MRSLPGLACCLSYLPPAAVHLVCLGAVLGRSPGWLSPSVRVHLLRDLGVSNWAYVSCECLVINYRVRKPRVVTESAAGKPARNRVRAGGCDPQLAVGSDIKPADSESRLGPEFRVRGGGKTRLVATCGGDGVWVYNVCVSSRGRENDETNGM